MEFTVPKIPTDNLYKFMALTGIVLVLLSFIPFYYAHKLKVKTIQLNSEIEILRQQREWLTKDVNDLEAASEKLIQRYDKYDEHAGRKDASDHVSELTGIKTRIDKKAEEVLKEVSKVQELNRQRFVSEAQQRAKHKELNYLLIIMRVGTFLSIFLFVGGSIFAYKGFLLWYSRLQIPLDRIIKKKEKDGQKQ